MTSPTTTTETTPHLYRCYTCLEVFTTGTERMPTALARCFCNGGLEYLGQVNNGRIQITFEAPACNDECIYARKDKCVCRCGGANHGSARTKIVRLDNGAWAPTAKETTARECEVRAEEFKAAIAAVWTRVGARYPEALATRRAGGFIPERAAFDAIVDAERIINAARRLRTHAGRLKRLAAAA